MKQQGFLLASLVAALMATSAVAQDISVKIGVLNDQSGLYSDITGEGSVVAARMAVEDFGTDKRISVEIVSADHQNKPDVGSNIARQWYDTENVDAIVDVPTSSVALTINEITREKNRVFLNSGAASPDLTGSACSPNTVHWTYDSWALANGTSGAMRRAASDTIEQDAEFGTSQGDHPLAGLVMFVNDVHALGLEVSQSLVLTESFYWDLNEQTREWSARFEEQMNSKPSMIQAGVYAAVLHYLKAIESLGSKDDGAAVVAQMKKMPTDDPLFGRGEVRTDGRKIHDMYLFRVKTPDQSEGAWDYYETVWTIPANQAFRPLGEGGCSLVQ